MLSQTTMPLISAPLEPRAMNVALVHSLIDEGRFHGALSYFTTRSLPPWFLPELHQVLQACFQSLLLEGGNLAVELFAASELALIESVAIDDPQWQQFIAWVASDYGTSKLGPILYPISFRVDQATAFIGSTLQQDCSLKDILGLLCISQICGCAPAELVDVALALASNPGLRMFSLRCLAEWTSLMRREDQELVATLIRTALSSVANRNDFLAAAYTLEKLSAPSASRYQLALAAIEKADVAGLDSHVADHFHVYILRQLSRQQLQELYKFSSHPRLSDQVFRQSLKLCLEAWLHIREPLPEARPVARVEYGFSVYLAALTQRLFPGGQSPGKAEPEPSISLSPAQIDLLRGLCQGETPSRHTQFEAILAALSADTASLELS